jgi:hypothetical protein
MVNRWRPALLALAALALAVGAWSWLGVSGARGALTGLGARQAESRATESTLPLIALARLKASESPPAEAEAGRDVFRFGRPPASAETKQPEPVVTQATPPPVDRGPATPPPPPTPPPLAVKYIGTVEQRGTKIALLLTEEKKEILTGREGDVVANRLKIVKIGLESVEVQDVGSERVRRIPLKGN